MVIREDAPMDLPTPTGPMRTLVFRPAAEGAKFPGLVLFSEIFQVTAPVRRLAAALAGHGFVVAVPEIFHDLLKPGEVLAYDTPGADRGNACKIGRTVKAYDDDSRAALEALIAWPACNGRLGAVGICIGGHLAFRAAMHQGLGGRGGVGVGAGACFYATDIHKGSLGAGGDDSLARVARGDLKAQMMMIWGRQDPHIDRAGRRMIFDAMSDAETNGGGPFSWHEFNAAHAFMRDEGSGGRYDPDLARLCLGMAVDHFRRTLG
jgi:carboxymethylenebutenolidase